MSDLDITFQIANTLQSATPPIYAYTLAANFRNVSGYACTLNRAADEPNFFFQRAPSAQLFTRCVSPQECAPSRASVDGPGVTLEPGTVGHQKYTWQIVPAHPDEPCVKAYLMDNTVNQDRAHFRLTSTILLRPICSPVIASAYASGPFPSDHRSTAGNSQLLPEIHFVPATEKYYEQGRVPISAVIEGPGQLLSLEQHSCPTLLVRIRAKLSGWIRFEEVRQKPCKSEPGVAAPGVRIALETELEGTELARGDNEVALSAVVELRSPQLMIIASPSFYLNIADPATMERKWGPQVKGIAVSLVLDKNTYELGSDIPLHIAMRNVAAEDTVIGTADPPRVQVELRDSCGLRLEPRDGVIWNGHGWCAEYPRGKIVPNELSLRDMGLVPETWAFGLA
jgi:hypothetical protein